MAMIARKPKRRQRVPKGFVVFVGETQNEKKKLPLPKGPKKRI